MRAFVWTVLLGLSVYNANCRLISAGDCYGARYLPFNLWKHGTLRLDPILDVVMQERTHAFWVVEAGGHSYSRYPVTTPVLLAPLYLPAVLYLNRTGWTDERFDHVARWMEKASASLIASLSAGLMHLLLIRTGCRRPWLWTLAFAFGTNTWMISSQALWQHGMAQLLMLAGLHLVLGPAGPRRAFALGICLALLASARPPDALVSAAIGFHALRRRDVNTGGLLLGALLGTAPVLAYNLLVFQTLSGGYGIGIVNPFRHNLAAGVLGLLFSPARGLFVFTPFLLFLPAALGRLPRNFPHRGLFWLLLASVCGQLLLFGKIDWRGGWSWGPRLLTDALPILVWILAAGLGHLRRAGRAVLGAAIGLSIGIQAVGAFFYTGVSDALIMRARPHPDPAIVWNPRHAPFWMELREGPAPRELWFQTRGNIDVARAGGLIRWQFLPGDLLEVEGWALTDLQTPAEVHVILSSPKVAGQRPELRVGIADRFFERPDVTEALGGKGPSGWRVVLNTEGLLQPGTYTLLVKARKSGGGEFRLVTRRELELLAPGLEADFRTASAWLRQRQHEAGFWLTAHTRGPRFDSPSREMNVFLTAVIHDMLAPALRGAAEEQDRLRESLALARRHLGEQIEPNGLVRYHGRTDAPTLPGLGVVITPDADDTALAWEIAGSESDERLQVVLGILNEYRTPEGLYRTWLAPPHEYISLCPGSDINPPDVAIQMHLLMFLARFDPEGAHRLYPALNAAMGEERIWVYYKHAPLIPYWRTAALGNLGFPLAFPLDRLYAEDPAQAAWLQACAYLVQATTEGAEGPDPVEVRTLLTALSADGFAAIRNHPPLLYHNDVTAPCDRYYWSEDFGYALWMRLYLELE